MFQGMDLNEIMNKAKELQKQMQEKKDQASTEVVEASVGGGMIRVKMNGNFELLELEIKEEILADKAILEDLMKAAINEALRKVKVTQGSGGGGNIADMLSGLDFSKIPGFPFGDKK